MLKFLHVEVKSPHESVKKSFICLHHNPLPPPPPPFSFPHSSKAAAVVVVFLFFLICYFLITAALQHVVSNPMVISGALLAYLPADHPQSWGRTMGTLLRKKGKRRIFPGKGWRKEEGRGHFFKGQYNPLFEQERSSRTKLVGLGFFLGRNVISRSGGNGGGKQMDEMGEGKFYACVGSGGD